MAHPEGGQVLGIEAEFDGSHEQLTQLRPEGPGAQRQMQGRGPVGHTPLTSGMTVEHLAQDTSCWAP
jgi:hypothetical protein